MNDLEHTFEYTKDAIRLSDAEKASGRAELLSLMQERPMRAPVHSPLSAAFFSPFLRYAIAAVLLVALGGSGVAYAATDAKPQDTLYVVKVKVTEPVQVALTFDPKKRADLEVKLVNQRLKEVAEASVDDTLTPKQLALVTASLSTQINHAQEDISSLQDTDQPDDAFETASDLAATLSAHTAILEKVQEANPDASDAISAVVSTVADELEETADLVDTSQEDVETGTATTTIAAPADEQAADTASALAQVKQEVGAMLADFDASDRADVEGALADIQTLIAQAQEADAAGDTKVAYILYAQADQALTSLKLTIEADQSLEIDVIDASTTSALDSTREDSAR